MRIVNHENHDLNSYKISHNSHFIKICAALPCVLVPTADVTGYEGDYCWKAQRDS